jgi:hypothetical protein
MQSKYTKIWLTTTVPRAMGERIREMAQQEQRSVSAIVRRLLGEALVEMDAAAFGKRRGSTGQLRNRMKRRRDEDR